MGQIELSTYVDALRDELLRCIEGSAGKDLCFTADKVDLEVEVEVEVTGGGGGEAKFRFLVFDATVKAEGSAARRSTQTIKLSLVPMYKGKAGPIWITKESMDALKPRS